MLDRLELLIGKDNIKKLNNAHIVILGLGGVGGYILESLVRSGIENITIIDYDKIEETNLNRQIIALKSTIGKDKTIAFKERILDINDKVKVNIINDFINETNIDKLFVNEIDYFIDACDSIKTKELVIDKCLKTNTKFITCMGTGNRINPSMLEIVDIRKTSNDPVAKILRKYLKDNKINRKIMCLSSKEVPLRKGKIIGSNSFVPPTAGLLIASYVVKDIINRD